MPPFLLHGVEVYQLDVGVGATSSIHAHDGCYSSPVLCGLCLADAKDFGGIEGLGFVMGLD